MSTVDVRMSGVDVRMSGVDVRMSGVDVGWHLLVTCRPPVNPAKQIVDPEDKKPADWDDKEK